MKCGICNHTIEDHTYSLDRVGCDSCSCKADVVTQLQNLLTLANERIEHLEAELAEARAKSPSSADGFGGIRQIF